MYKRKTTHLIIYSLLLSLLAVTRFGHVVPFNLPDASWAVFFLGGYYLRSVFQYLSLFLVALLVDIFVIGAGLLPASCINWGYAALLPAYGMLWCSGYALYRLRAAKTLLRYAYSALAIVFGVSAAFALSNLGFYWGGANASSGLDLWAFTQSVAVYYPSFLWTTISYAVPAAIVLNAVRLFVEKGFKRLLGVRGFQ